MKGIIILMLIIICSGCLTTTIKTVDTDKDILIHYQGKLNGELVEYYVKMSTGYSGVFNPLTGELKGE